MLAEARSALGKQSVILDQLGVSGSLERVRNEAAALKALDVAFDRFLKGTDAVTVPLALDITSVLDDYFARRPPFSAKKKAEFPDAISIASICRWCEQNHATAYVVSEDGDLRECCSDSGPLFHANSITEIISQATVSQAFHEALENALRESKYLSDRLAQEIKDIEIEIDRDRRDGTEVLSATISGVDSINLVSVNVLERDGLAVTCEVEVEAALYLDIEVEVEGRRYHFMRDDYEPARRHSVHQCRTEYFYPEVIARFDSSTGNLEFESIGIGMGRIRVGPNEIQGLP